MVTKRSRKTGSDRNKGGLSEKLTTLPVIGGWFQRFLKRYGDNAVKYFFMAMASTSVIIVALIFFFLFKEGTPFFWKHNVGNLLTADWIPVRPEGVVPSFGILPLIVGSLLVTTTATIFCVPLGIFSAVYISKIAGNIEREVLKPFLELLATIPSVVFGFFALVVIVPIVQRIFGLSTGMTAFTGAVILTLMALPTIITISEDSIRAVPQSYRQASLALGATEYQTTWKVIVPSAMSGIIAAVMLGIGRVIGETMAVLMVTGNSRALTFNPLESVRTMTATIAAEMGEVVYGDVHYNALFIIGIVLLLFTFGLNMIAQRFLRYKEVA